MLPRWVSLLIAVLFVAGCAAEPAKKSKRAPTPGDDSFIDLPGQDDALQPDLVNSDSEVFDGRSEQQQLGPKVFCEGDLKAGDLALVEIMIASKSGSGDAGEWAEIQNVRDCWLKLKGLAIESPRGAAEANSVTISDELDLAPGATFVVADSADPTKNHQIPGKIYAWNSTDVLKNDGDTLNLKIGDVTIDSLTYPAIANLSPGRALSFPHDCKLDVRKDWGKWSLGFEEYATGFKGTPNKKNADVACP